MARPLIPTPLPSPATRTPLRPIRPTTFLYLYDREGRAMQTRHGVGVLLSFLLLSPLAGIVAADLPPSVVATVSPQYGETGALSYWSVVMTDGGGDLPTGTTWNGWCVDSQTTLSSGTHTFDVYSSMSLPPGAPPYLWTVTWPKVNYLLNHKGSAGIPPVQAAIWHYDGGIPGFTHTYDAWFSLPAYTSLCSDADGNGGGYIPGPREVYGVILYTPGKQCLIIEVPVPHIPVPEFPLIRAMGGCTGP